MRQLNKPLLTYLLTYLLTTYFLTYFLQLNLKDSNTDGSFAWADLNSFLSPQEILPIAQENKYLGIF